MTKRMNKILTVAMAVVAAVATLAFVACGDDSENDWSTMSNADYEAKWLANEFDDKEISYQIDGMFTAQGKKYVSLNLFKDGSAILYQADGRGCIPFMGYWGEFADEDCNKITLTLKCSYGNDGESTGMHSNISKQSVYELYEQSDGNYSAKVWIQLAYGKYDRECSIKGGRTLKYSTFAEVKAAKPWEEQQ